MRNHLRFRWLLVTVVMLVSWSCAIAQDVASYRQTIYDNLNNSRTAFIEAINNQLQQATDPDEAESLAKSKESMLVSLRELRIPQQVPSSLLAAKKSFKLDTL